MNNFNYNEHTNHISSNFGIDKSDIFLYEGTPLEDICGYLFQFFQNSFDRDFSHFDILPGYFFFGNNKSLNGWATRRQHGSIICIFIGAVYKLADKFLVEDRLSEKSSNTAGLKKVEEVIATPTNELLLQSAYLFFFYHELGHLIQRSSSDNVKMMEVTTSKDSYSNESHVRETDADMFSGIQLARHILNGYDKFVEEDKNIDTLSDLTSIVAAGAGLIMISIIDFSEVVYSKQKTHPHSFVRLMIILDTVINYTLLKLGIPNAENSFREKLVRKTIYLIDELLPTLYDNQFRENLMSKYTESKDEIFVYANELISEVKNYPKGAINKWNMSVYNRSTGI